MLYCYKILGHGITPCLRMMRGLPLIQRQGINYKITHNPLNQYLWAHDLHDSIIKHLQCHHHQAQLPPGIQVQVTLHQRYIKVHLEGLISGVHLLSHHHYIFRFKPLCLHPYTPWRSAIPLGELRNSAEGHVLCLWGSSRQLSQPWFVN